MRCLFMVDYLALTIDSQVVALLQDLGQLGRGITGEWSPPRWGEISVSRDAIMDRSKHPSASYSEKGMRSVAEVR